MSYSTDKATFLTNVGVDISSKTTTSSITPTNVGGNTATPDLHGLAGVTILTDDLYALISAAGDFNTVLTTGNTATDVAAKWDSATAGAPYVIVDNTGYKMFSSTGDLLAQILRTGGGTTDGGQITIKDPATSYYANLITNTLSAGRNYTLPDESGNLVTHTTKDIIIVATGVNQGYLDNNALGLKKSLVNQIRFVMTAGGGTPTLEIKSSSTSHATQVTSSALLPANNIVVLPEQDCNLLGNFGGNSSQALVAASTMVIAHSLPFTPSRVMSVVPKTAASGAAMAGYFATVDATNLTIHFAAPVTATVEVDYQLAP